MIKFYKTKNNIYGYIEYNEDGIGTKIEFVYDFISIYKNIKIPHLDYTKKNEIKPEQSIYKDVIKNLFNIEYKPFIVNIIDGNDKINYNR